ncbi:MAG: PIG-L deacetylase family protein [Planctomycetota bacterium]
MHEPVPLPFPTPKALEKTPRGKVVVIAPHPDDEAIGCGGAAILHRLAGDPVRVLVITDGRAGDCNHRWQPSEYVAMRRRESVEAGKVMGVLDYTFWDFPDSCVITENDMNFISARILEWLKLDPPDIVYAPWVGEGNTDHAAVGEMTRMALRALDFRGICYGYEVYCPAPVDVVLDITAVADCKRSALQQFPSQLESTPLDHLIFGLNAARSLFLPKGSRYGEGYVTWTAASQL